MSERPGPSSDPELVLSQALRAIAGGRSSDPAAPPTPEPGRRLTLTQILLVAALVGVTVGMAAGIVTLLAGWP